MRISEMTPEQQAARREYNREQKRKSRANQKAAAYTPTADEWCDEFSASEQYNELDSHTKRFVKVVAEELGREIKDPRFPLGYITPEADIVEQVAWVLHSFRKNLIQRVDDPVGEIFGGMFFADSIGSNVVAGTHKLNLEQSSTYSITCRELLVLLDRRYGQNGDTNSIAVKAELSGEYTLPEPKPEAKQEGQSPKEPKPEPKPETKPIAEPKKQDAQEDVWSQLNKHLDEAASRYLEGI
jgi:hypothetical protein